MSRPRFAWFLFGICLLATTAAVGWLTAAAWRADQARQQALLESEIRNALWRLDSLAAPLLAVEINRPSFSVSFANTPMLAPRLIKGYVVRNLAGSWTIRRAGPAAAPEPLTAGSPFPSEDWHARLGPSVPATGVPSELASAETALADALIIWPNGLGFQSQGGPSGPRMSQGSAIGQKLQPRNQLVQQLQQIAVNSQQRDRETPSASTSFIPLQPIWVAGELVLARLRPARQEVDAGVVELCWLNWQEWELLLSEELAGLSIPFHLQPCEFEQTETNDGGSAEWKLVSLPIRLVPLSHRVSAAWLWPLVAVWVSLLIVALALCGLLRQTLDLSERRAAFVSAVTHELRTPLTTFRLYTELLSDGVVTDPAQQQAYFQILNREANRLALLVENVLAYARLEHGRATARNETLTVDDLIDRCRPRLEQRVAETTLALSFHISDAAHSVKLTTNALAVEQILFNLIDNACKYARGAADPRIICETRIHNNHLRIQITDFGPGLSAAARKTLFQPFQKSALQAAESAPGIGLGLTLSQRLARDLRGSLASSPNHPTGLCFVLQLPLRGK